MTLANSLNYFLAHIGAGDWKTTVPVLIQKVQWGLSSLDWSHSCSWDELHAYKKSTLQQHTLHTLSFTNRQNNQQQRSRFSLSKEVTLFQRQWEMPSNRSTKGFLDHRSWTTADLPSSLQITQCVKLNSLLALRCLETLFDRTRYNKGEEMAKFGQLL